jgi:hypothetical protein
MPSQRVCVYDVYSLEVEEVVLLVFLMGVRKAQTWRASSYVMYPSFSEEKRSRNQQSSFSCSPKLLLCPGSSDALSLVPANGSLTSRSLLEASTLAGTRETSRRFSDKSIPTNLCFGSAETSTALPFPTRLSGLWTPGRL